MSEANILNPNAASALNPDFPYAEIPEPAASFAVFLPRSGAGPFARRIDGRPRAFRLTWTQRPQADIDALRQWAYQYHGDYFSLYDLERGRYYTGTFVTPIEEVDWIAHDQVTAAAVFQEIAGLPLYQYWGGSASDWTRDGVLRYPRDSYGNDFPKKTGTWTYGANANAKNGSDFTNANTNTTEWVEAQYWGYGFRVWLRTGPDLGIGALSCTDLAGNVELAATNIDLYAAGAAAAAVVNTTHQLKLGWHRVKWQATNTKNASSSAKTLPWDTLEVMK